MLLFMQKVQKYGMIHNAESTKKNIRGMPDSDLYKLSSSFSSSFFLVQEHSPLIRLR